MNLTDLKTGLTSNEVEHRVKNNLINKNEEPTTKSIKQIILSNIFTKFNLLNFSLAILVAFTGQWRNILFIFVAISNTLIKIIEEIRAKKNIDKLSVIIKNNNSVIRDGKPLNIKNHALVKDDIIILKQGDQIVSDCILREGQVEVNESLLTGESDSIRKNINDELLSGSYIISGKCKAQIIRFGAENFSSKITYQAKKAKKSNSEILNGLNKIIFTIGIFLLPLGTITFIKQYFLLHEPIRESIISSVASIIGMIPNGLVLLTSSALAIGAVRLAKSNTLVQDLYCIETLARVDTLCIDKTGTLTDGKIEVQDILPLNTSHDVENIKNIISEILCATGDENNTAQALKQYVGNEYIPQFNAISHTSFSSEKKYSMASFENKGTYVIGAADVLLKYDDTGAIKQAQNLALNGYRILSLFYNENAQNGDNLPAKLTPIALITLSEKLRDNVKETLEFFAEQNVDIKIISGDNPLTVSNIAQKAGLKNYEKYADLTDMTDEELIDIVNNGYSIYGRAKPDQKKLIIKTLKENNHVTAMIGDGVNDVLALRESDCSIALASGSESTRNISHLVLMDSSFSSLPKILDEGRRIINNIGRVAPLFLVKTITAIALVFIYFFINSSYPFAPIHYTIIGSLTVGIPAFFLAMQPNKKRVTDNFLLKVFSRAIPGAIAFICNIISLEIINKYIYISEIQKTSLSVWVYAIVGIIVLGVVCYPLDKFRKILWVSLSLILILALILFSKYIYMSPLNLTSIIILLILIVLTPIFMFLTSKVQIIIRNLRKNKKTASFN